MQKIKKREQTTKLKKGNVLVFVVVKITHERNLTLSHSENVSTQFKAHLFYVVCVTGVFSKSGTPSKRQVSKRPVSKLLKRQVYKTSALQNVRFTKCQVYKTSGLQNVRFCTCGWWKSAGSVASMFALCRQSYGCVFFSNLEFFFVAI
jgi:hypothetical protein